MQIVNTLRIQYKVYVLYINNHTCVYACSKYYVLSAQRKRDYSSFKAQIDYELHCPLIVIHLHSFVCQRRECELWILNAWLGGWICGYEPTELSDAAAPENKISFH